MGLAQRLKDAGVPIVGTQPEAIELAEAGPDDALGGSGVLVIGSVVTAGEARTLLAGART